MQLENINDSYFLKSNDTATQIHLRVLDYEGNPFPLDTATKIEVVIGVEAGRVLVLTPKLLAGVGEIEFGLDEGDLVPSGKNRLEVHIYTASGEKHNAPSKGYYTLNIQKPIDELGVEVTTYTLDYFLDQVSKATAGLDDIIADGKDAVDKLNEASGRVDGIVTAANTALTNATTATTKANEATATANAASQTANTAVTNANAATQSANTAAGAANTAASTANQAVVNANAAIKNANDAATEANLWANKAENATQDADNAVVRADAATAKANVAAESVTGWGMTTEWSGAAAYKAKNTVTYNGSTWQAKRDNTNVVPVNGDDWLLLAQRGVDGEGSVSSVNGQFPDPDGNVQLDLGAGTVKSVNNVQPNAQGNVTLLVGVTKVNGKTGGLQGVVTLNASDVGAETPTGAQEKADAVTAWVKAHGFGANNTEIRKIADYNEFMSITESGIYTYLQTSVGSLGLPTDGSNYVLYVTVGSEAVSGATFMSALAVEVGSNDLFSISGKAYTRSVIKRSNGNTNKSEWTEVGSTTPTLYTNEDMFLYHALKDGGIYTVESETGSEFFPKGDTIYTVLVSVYMIGAEKQLSYVAVEGNTRGESAVTGRVLSRFIVADGDTATQDSGWIESGGGGAVTKSFFAPYKLATTAVGQKTWDLPADSYDSETDSLVVFHNTVYLTPASYTVTGTTGAFKITIPDNPHSAIADNNLAVLVLKNAPATVSQISGTLLTDNSVDLGKLGKTVTDVLDGKADKSALSTVSTSVGGLVVALDDHKKVMGTTETAGHFKPDGVTLTVDPVTGVASAKGGSDTGNVPEYTGDLNNLVTTGLYYYPAGTLNAPTSSAGFVQVIANADNVVQLSQALSNGVSTYYYVKRVARKVSDSFVWGDSGYPDLKGWAPPVRLQQVAYSASQYEAASAYALKTVNDAKADKALESYQNLSLQNGINGVFRYYRDGFGIVHVEVFATSGTLTANTVIGVLPVGYRPPYASLSVNVVSYLSDTPSDAVPMLLEISGSTGQITNKFARKNAIAGAFSFRAN